MQRRLQRRGLDAATAAGKAPLFAAAARALGYDDAAASPAAALSTSAHALFVPGRIEVMGKHTDYCGGRSLLGAINKGFCVVATPRDDDAVRVVTLEPSIPEADRSVTLSLVPRQQSAAQAQAAALPAGHWSNYVACTVNRVAANFPGLLRGLDMAIGCDLPPASGMSTSSAMICAVFKALAAVSGAAGPGGGPAGAPAGAGGGLEGSARFQAFLGAPERLYEYLGCIENGQSFVCAAGVLAGDKGVGTFGGSEVLTSVVSFFHFLPTNSRLVSLSFLYLLRRTTRRSWRARRARSRCTPTARRASRRRFPSPRTAPSSSRCRAPWRRRRGTG